MHPRTLSESGPSPTPSPDAAKTGRPRIVIIGGGFAGLSAARSLGSFDADVTLIDRRNFHLFQPLLYQVATGGLSPANIATPLRWALRRHKNIDIRLGEVNGFDVEKRQVLLSDEAAIEYDHLIVAAGATHSYFGNDWQALAPGLKSIEDATEIRSRILAAFEYADQETDRAKRAELLTFVIVGGGPTGVELAGALGEISRHTLRKDFRNIDPAESRVILIDAVDRVLTSFPEALSQKASQSLAELGVEVITNARVAEINPGNVVIERNGENQSIACATPLWAAGVQGSPLGRLLAAQLGQNTDRAGRIAVNQDLTIPDFSEISVIGDLALFTTESGQPLPGVAPVAMQQGLFVAQRIKNRISGQPTTAFTYRDRGNLATIGRARAVADFGRFQSSGLPAWILWLFVHLMYLAQAESRILVFTQWAWSYLTYNRSARLITHPPTSKDLGAD